ncbi:hypothetical protein ACHAQD_005600 [Fusarium lateritium]
MKEDADTAKPEKGDDNKAEQYFALRSFFQDSWIQVPDGETHSRIMKPRAPKQEEVKLPRDDSDKFQDADAAEHKAHETNKFANVPQASAVYLPYFCFSTCHNEARDKLKDPTKLKAYQELLVAYNGLVIHESPTLDEWYYHFAKDDQKSVNDRNTRNQEQVVTKFLKEREKAKKYESNAEVAGQASKRPKPAEPRSDDHWIVLRVNQIWIWNFANKWIITASSCSLDDSQETLVEGILRQLKKQVEYGGSDSQPGTTEAMKELIVEYCVASYERKPIQEPKMSIGQIFSHYMNRIGRDETTLFQMLRRGAIDGGESQDTADLEEPTTSLPDEYTDRGTVGEEKMRESIKLAEKLVADINDVRDELNILKSAARFQKKVQIDLAGNNAKSTNLSADYVENDIKEMDDVAERIQSALDATLSLQQSQIANNQTEIARQQNTVLMTFTAATIFFLPLSFLTSLFALDAEKFSQTPVWMFVVIFIVSLGVTAIILVLALSANKFIAMKNKKGPPASSPGMKGQKGSSVAEGSFAEASPEGAAKTVKTKGEGGLSGRLMHRHGRTKLGDQELGNMK